MINFANHKKETLKELLLDDCSQFIEESCELFYRGITTHINDYKIFTPPKNRIPKNTDKDSHKLLNDFSLEKIGFPARSGVFTTKDSDNAEIYTESETGEVIGDVCIFLPMNGYKYAYIPGVDDLTNHLSPVSSFHLWKINKNLSLSEEEEYQIYKKEKEDIIKGFVEKYKTTNLKDTGNEEVSFICDGYYLIAMKYKNVVEELIT